MKIAVGSKNQVKINATRDAFERVWPDLAWEVLGISVPSGVADQPMSVQEGILGAKNRAIAALKAQPDADYGVGLEGYIEEIEGDYFCSGWVAITDTKGIIGLGSSGRTPVPPSFIEAIRHGSELAEAYEEISKQENSKQKEGFNGFMTLGAMNRTEVFALAVMSALGRFTRQTLF